MKAFDPDEAAASAGHAGARRQAAPGADLQRLAGNRAVGQLAQPAVQRNKGTSGFAPFADQYNTDILQSTAWETEATMFENRLGTYAYNHPKAIRAADLALRRLHEVITSQGGSLAVFGGDAALPGHVGTDAAAVGAVLARGNLRERMTAFSNAAFASMTTRREGNRTVTTASNGTLSAIVNELVRNGRWDTIGRLGLNEAALRDEAAWLNSVKRSWKKGTTSSGGTLYGRDLFALGNIVRGKTAAARSLSATPAAATLERDARDAGRGERKITPANLRGAGAPLSEREQAHLNAKGAAGAGAGAAAGAAAAGFVDNVAWYVGTPTARRDRGMPVVSTPSGTAVRMLAAFRWLNVTGVAEDDFRLAILGWMLTSRQHTFHEVMASMAHLGGTYQPGIHAYRNVPGLSVAELRDHVGVNRMFPHENVYMRHAREFKLGETERSEMKFNQLRADGIAPSLSQAHIEALYAYTNEGHRAINRVLDTKNYPDFVARKAVLEVIERQMLFAWASKFVDERENLDADNSMAADHSIAEGAEDGDSPDVVKAKALKRSLRDRGPEVTELLDPVLNCQDDIAELVGSDRTYKQQKAAVSAMAAVLTGQILPEARLQANMMFEALHLLPAATGTVYHGTTTGPFKRSYKTGATFTLDSFMSTSRSASVANDFMGDPPVRLRIELAGHGGKDIRQISSKDHEQEVLLMPGTTFRVREIIRPSTNAVANRSSGVIIEDVGSEVGIDDNDHVVDTSPPAGTTEVVLEEVSAAAVPHILDESRPPAPQADAGRASGAPGGAQPGAGAGAGAGAGGAAQGGGRGRRNAAIGIAAGVGLGLGAAAGIAAGLAGRGSDADRGSGAERRPDEADRARQGALTVPAGKTLATFDIAQKGDSWVPLLKGERLVAPRPVTVPGGKTLPLYDIEAVSAGWKYLNGEAEGEAGYNLAEAGAGTELRSLAERKAFSGQEVHDDGSPPTDTNVVFWKVRVDDVEYFVKEGDWQDTFGGADQVHPAERVPAGAAVYPTGQRRTVTSALAGSDAIQLCEIVIGGRPRWVRADEFRTLFGFDYA